MVKTSLEIIMNMQDLAYEILARLPPKSLAIAKCISKQFHSLISNPYFQHYYHLLNPPSLSGHLLIPITISHMLQIKYIPLMNSKNNPITPSSLNFISSQGFHVLQSCNGLLLCSSLRDAPKRGFKYYICNPTTCQIVNLPNCPYIKKVHGLALAFDPVISPYYKVVRAKMVDERQGLCIISVYTSKTGLWTPGKPFVAPEIKGMDFSQGVYFNGKIHWMKTRKSSRGVYFDLDTKCLKLMPKLDDKYYNYGCGYFGHSQGHLYLALKSKEVIILEMNQDYSGWSLKFKIDQYDLLLKFPSIGQNSVYTRSMCSDNYDVLSVIRDDQITVLLSIPGQVIAYNENKTSWKVCDMREWAWFQIYSTYQYYETIFSL